MTIIYDRTDTLGTQGVMHALVVGISQYAYLPNPDEPPNPDLYGMRKLDAPSRSAAQMARWLYDHRDAFDKKLASIRFLAVPATDERADMNTVLSAIDDWSGPVDSADLMTFAAGAKDWRIRAAQRKENAAFFYFAGHGLERTGSQILALEDFGDSTLGRFAKAAMLQNIHDGMAPSADFPDIARTQYYFVDACRTKITDAAGLTTTATTIFDTISGLDDRVAPIFYASYPGEVALARRGGVTEYLPILLRALSTAAQRAPGDGRWGVDSLAVFDMIDRLRQRADLSRVPPGDSFGKAVILWLPAAPKIDFRVAVRPDLAVGTTEIEFSSFEGGVGKHIAAEPQEHPYATSLPAGLYRVSADPGREDLRPYENGIVIDYKLDMWPVELEPVHEE